MAARDVRKNFTINVDGRGYAGNVDEFNAPKLALVVEEYRAGGMDMPVELTMGMEKLESDFSLTAYDKNVLALFGVVEGAFINFTAREVLESFDGTVTAVIHNMRGKIRMFDPGTSKSGELQPIKFEMSLVYYKLTHGGAVIMEIDAENMVRVINGVDVMASQRAALGM